MTPEIYDDDVLRLAKQCGLDPERVAEVRRLSPAEMEDLTNAYIREGSGRAAYNRLRLAGDLKVPHLIRVLEREDAFEKIAGQEDRYYGETPASLALAMLHNGVYETLKPLLLGWLRRSTDKEILKKIAPPLVAYGSDDLFPDIRRLFEHDDESVRYNARYGAFDPVKEGRAEPKFREYVWDHCVELMHSPNPPSELDPTRLLKILDPEASKQLFDSPEFLREDYPLLAEVLSSLNGLKSPANAEFLRRLVKEPIPGPKHRQERVRLSALYGLLRRQDAAASEFVEAILKKPKDFSEDTVFAAWRARFRIRGLEFAYDTALDAYAKAGGESLDALSPSQRDMVLIDFVDNWFTVGGLGLWYSYYGDSAEATVLALEKVGASEHARLIGAMAHLLSPQGVPLDRDSRDKQLEEMTEEEDEKLAKLDEKMARLPSAFLFAVKWDWRRQTRPKRNGNGVSLRYQ